MAKKRRLSLTKAQQQAGAGAELLALCQAITEDGVISKEEILALRRWLKANRDSDLPAIEFLTSTVEKIIADRVVTKEERKELCQAIEKVLPPDVRKAAVQQRRVVEASDKERIRAQREADRQREQEALERKQEQLAEEQQKKELAKRMREFRKMQNGELRQARKMRGTVARLKVIAAEDSCDYCRSQNGRTYSIERCPENWLPPWGQCTHELGCRCYVEIQLHDDLVEGLPPADYGPAFEAAQARAAREATEARRAGVLPIDEEPLYVRLQEFSIAWGAPPDASQSSATTSSTVAVRPTRRSRSKSGCLLTLLTIVGLACLAVWLLPVV